MSRDLGPDIHITYEVKLSAFVTVSVSADSPLDHPPDLRDVLAENLASQIEVDPTRSLVSMIDSLQIVEVRTDRDERLAIGMRGE